MGFNSKISLVDIEPVLDPKTGKNKLKIVRETEVYADKQEVGMEEYYSAANQKISLVATYEVPAHLYHGEKYLLAFNRTVQFEISRAAKGRSLSYIKLPVTSVQSNKLLDGMKNGS